MITKIQLINDTDNLRYKIGIFISNTYKILYTFLNKNICINLLKHSFYNEYISSIFWSTKNNKFFAKNNFKLHSCNKNQYCMCNIIWYKNEIITFPLFTVKYQTKFLKFIENIFQSEIRLKYKNSPLITEYSFKLSIKNNKANYDKKLVNNKSYDHFLLILMDNLYRRLIPYNKGVKESFLPIKLARINKYYDE